MSTTTVTSSARTRSALASSSAFRTFATVFAIAAPVLYVVFEMANWPLFTYHPATNKFDLGWAPSVRDQGPARHWYGWTLGTLLGSAVLGLIATRLPESMTRRIPLALVWATALAAIPILIYGLRFYWRWE